MQDYQGNVCMFGTLGGVYAYIRTVEEEGSGEIFKKITRQFTSVFFPFCFWNSCLVIPLDVFDARCHPYSPASSAVDDQCFHNKERTCAASCVTKISFKLLKML